MKLKIRSQFIASKGMTFLACDLSQGETWCYAHLANDMRMINALKVSDIHALTAASIYHPSKNICSHDLFKTNSIGYKECQSCSLQILTDQRYIGKKCNHGFAYEMKAEEATKNVNAESDRTNVTVSISEMKRNREIWLSLYPSMNNWWGSIRENLWKNNRKMINTYGRSRTFFGRMDNDLFKEATAWEPQSTIADHGTGVIHLELGIKGGLVGIADHPEIDKYCSLVHTAYDSVMLEVPERDVESFAGIVAPLFCRDLIVNGYMFKIPIDMEHGKRYGELEAAPKAWYN